MALSVQIATRPTRPAPPAPRSRLPEIDLLRAFCCLGVLLIHISGFYWAQPHRDPSFRHMLTYAVVNEAVRYALFGFMFISGLLLTVRKGHTFQVFPFLGKRIQTVLIPYLAWVAIYFVVAVLVSPQHLMLKQLIKALHGSGPHIKIVAGWLLFGTWPHLYFINMIFQMYVLYALLYRPVSWLLADWRRTFVLVVAVFAAYPLWVYFRMIATVHADAFPHLFVWMAKNPNRLALEWLAPFTFGLACGAYYSQFLDWARRNRAGLWAMTLTALAFTVACVVAPRFAPSVAGFFKAPFTQKFLSVLFRLCYAFGFNCLLLPTAFAWFERIGEWRPKWLQHIMGFAAASFGIYLFHPLLLELFRKLHIPGSKWGFSFAVYRASTSLYLVLITVLVTGISYLVVAGLNAWGKRWQPAEWAYRVLFGR